MGHAVTQQLGANHTCARVDGTLSRARRGHLGTLPATPVLLLTLSPPHIDPCGTPPPLPPTPADGATYCTGYMHDRPVCEGQRALFTRSRCESRKGFSTRSNSSTCTVVYVYLILSIPFSLSVQLTPSGRSAVSQVAPSVWVKARFGTGLGKKAAYERLCCHDSK